MLLMLNPTHNTNPRHPAAGLTLNPKPSFVFIDPAPTWSHCANRCGRQPKCPPQKRLEEATRGIETKAPSHRARRCGRQPNKWPPQKRPEEATRHPEFARNHSGSIEMQRNSRETTAGASKRNGTRAKPQRERRSQGPVPPHAPLRSATNSFTLNVRTPLCKHCLGNL